MISIDFYGRVTGVGFRFFILDKATKYKIIGFVKNENDGTVHVECHESKNFENFIDEIKKEHPGHIERIKIENFESDKKHNSFCIKF